MVAKVKTGVITSLPFGKLNDSIAINKDEDPEFVPTPNLCPNKLAILPNTKYFYPFEVEF